MDADELVLDRGKTLQFVWNHYGHGSRVGGQTDSLHAEQVADRAEKLCQAYYRELRGFIAPMDASYVEMVWHAGVLHEVLSRTSTTYEELCELTCPTTANLVSLVTRDKRLSIGPRAEEFRGRIGQAEPLAQLLALADMECNLKQGLELYKRDPQVARIAMSVWVSNLQDDLTCLHNISPFSSIRSVIKRARKATSWLHEQFKEGHRLDRIARTPRKLLVAQDLI